MAPRVLSAIMFSPRGGSAPAAHALARGLRDRGSSVTLLAGSRRDLGPHGEAGAFYGAVHAVSFDAALASDTPVRFEGSAGSAPLHPSFEDRPGAPDIVFAKLDDLDYERQVRAWCREFELADARGFDVLHLHHLTPLNEAAARVAPDVPVVGQLHGTELLMLERIVAGAPAGWRHAERWAARIRAWADRCARLVVAPSGVERAVALLGVPRERVVALPNGVDVELFVPRAIDRDAFWQRILVGQPQGWLPGQPPGSLRYLETEARQLAAGSVLLYVGRFTAVKRLDRLIGAFGRAQDRFVVPAGLVLVGGHPGEWEGEHPADIAARVGAPRVFLAGWHAQQDLPEFLSAADAIVLTSEREQFGQVLIEAMACGVPAVATRSLGPTAIIEDRRTGWLVEPDDDAALAAALAEVVNDPHERERRGQAARRAVRERFSWATIAAKLEAVLEEVIRDRPAGNDPRAEYAPSHEHHAA
ncbi:MAG TPA: glycosyltransferase family 4 protein [Solirubrobacteraceae bacterium]|nr:glycosyltransferase family 4 protein [Solirubrobacteraceae bacterium]